MLTRFLANQLEIHEKRYASAVPAALRPAVPLHFAREFTTSQSVSDTSNPAEPGAAAPAWDNHLPKHVEHVIDPDMSLGSRAQRTPHQL